MNEEIKKYLEKYPEEIADLYAELRGLLYDSVSGGLEETMWAKLPSYYAGEKFVRLIPFKDHINIEAQSLITHKSELDGYKITPKGMLQLYAKQDVPKEILLKAFSETLGG